MPARNGNSPSPARRIGTNLDELEKENPIEPFVALVGGKEITFIDARDLPWDELNKIDDPDEFMWRCLSEEDYDFFLAQKVPGWKIEILSRDYQRHFGIGTRGNGRGSRT